MILKGKTPYYKGLIGGGGEGGVFEAHSRSRRNSRGFFGGEKKILYILAWEERGKVR